MAGKYASTTGVTVDRSRAEVEQILSRYGATMIMYGWDQDQAMIQFEASGRRIRFLLPMPDREDPAFTMTPSGKQRRSDTEAHRAWEQGCRQRWRALVLVIKAKLEAVETGISEFEAEFLANVVLPNGVTVGDFMRPQIDAAYVGGQMPSGMHALGAGS